MSQAPGTRVSLINKFADRYTLEPGNLLATLKHTAFKQRQSDPEPTNEEMAALLVVADQYGLNPFTREIFAFKDKYKGIVPVVSIDGWSRIINSHDQFDGMAFVTPGGDKKLTEELTRILGLFPETKGNKELEALRYEFEALLKIIPAGDGDIVAPQGGKRAFSWMTSVIYRKDRARPSHITEYFDEVYQEPRGENKVHGPWQSHPKRFHRHKVLIQNGRITFGFAGIYDDDEADRIIQAQVIEGQSTRVPTEKSSTARMAQHLKTATTDQATAEHGTGDVQGQEQASAESGAKPLEQGTAATADTQARAEAPSVEAIGEMIATMTQGDRVQEVMNLIGRHPVEPEQRALMVKWNARVLEMKGIAPAATEKAAATEQAAQQQTQQAAAKEKGSPQRLGRLKMAITEAPDLECLDDILDESRGYHWTPDQEAAIKSAGDERREMLTGTPGTKPLI